MNDHKLTRKDWNLLAICGALLLISILYLNQNYRKAFPAYDLKFNVNRAESRILAEKFLSRQNIDLNGYRHAVIFNYDEISKIFIEKEVDPAEAGQLLSEDFPIWRWSNRWFRPLSREEFKVSLTLDGKITDFEHILPEEAAAASISLEAARQICQEFLITAMQATSDEWEFLEEKTDIKPNRTDYYFTYKKKGVEIFNATYRLEIGVQGDKIGKYREYWKLPEQWLRNYRNMRSLNSTTALTADLFFFLLLVAALIVFIIQLNRRNVHIKTAMWFGIITIILQIASQLNELPIQIYAFDTNQSLGNYYGNYVIQTFLVALLYGLLVAIVAGAGEALYRRAHPDHFALAKVFSPAGLRTKSFLTKSIAGLVLAVVFIAYQTCFYVVANRFGAWAPTEVTYSNVLNTYLPWIFVLLIGFIPAVTEEFSFRLFAIPFIGKIFRSKPLAILVPALIWGFAHANYPNQPFWIRGAEVSLFAIFIGMIFMRFGILTVLVWHYTVDAIYTAVFLVKTGQPYLIVTACLAAGLILLPILYNLISYLRTRRFADSSGLLNNEPLAVTEPEAIPAVEIPTAPESAAYVSYSPRKVRIGLIISAIFCLVLLIPSQRVGEFYNYPIAKNEIKRTAAEYLSQQGVSPEDYKMALGINHNYDPLMGQYVIEHSSLRQLNTTMAQYLPDLIAWEVRFFQANQREEYRIFINPMSNTVVAFDHILDETAAGANLPKSGAQKIAEEFLTLRKINIADFTLVESNSQVLPNRTDYNFIWESRPEHPASIAEARLRLKVAVKGGEIASFATDYKIPEDWLLIQTRHTTIQSVMTGLQIGLLIILIFWVVLCLFKKRQTAFSGWRLIVKIAALITILTLVVSGPNHSGALLGYDTSWSLTNWNFLWILLNILKALAIGLISALVLSAIGFLHPDTAQALRRTVRPQYTRDALIASVMIISGLLAISRLTNIVINQINPALLARYFTISGLEESAFPFFDAVQIIIFKSVLITGIVALAAFMLKNLIKNDFLRILTLIVITAIFLPDNYLALSTYLTVYLQFILPLIWLFFCLKYFISPNPPAYLYTAIGYFLVIQINNLLTFGSPSGRFAAVLLIIVGSLIILKLVTEKQEITLRYLIKRYLK